MGRLAENYNIHAKSPLITISKGAKIYLDTRSTSPLQTLHPSSSGKLMVSSSKIHSSSQSWEMRCIVSLRSQVPCLFYGPSCIVPITNQLLAIYIYLYLLLFCLTLVVFYRKAWLIPQYWLLIDKRKLLGYIITNEVYFSENLWYYGGARVLIDFPISGGPRKQGAWRQGRKLI